MPPSLRAGPGAIPKAAGRSPGGPTHHPGHAGSFWKLPLPVLWAQGLLSARVICSLGAISDLQSHF